MRIIIDTREKSHIIQKILAEFDKQGVEYIRSKLYVGDYQRFDNPFLVIDRKHNLSELAGNVGQDHKRFVAELKRAQDMGVKVVILCEHGGTMKTLEDVQRWVNPRLKTSPLAITGPRLYKILLTLQNKYGVEFRFCSKARTGREIIKILEGGNK